jgi:hypothetical protein
LFNAFGEPLNETAAWLGPIVMNTPEELDLAFKKDQEGTFTLKEGYHEEKMRVVYSMCHNVRGGCR